MKEAFKIFVERLKKGQVEKIDESFDPDFLEIHEKELAFQDPVAVKGEAYLADQELILKFASISARALLPCSICNQEVAYPIEIRDFIMAKPLAEIKSHVFDFRQELREAILLEVPFIVECHDGACPERKNLSRYMTSPDKRSSDEEGWQPFKDL